MTRRANVCAADGAGWLLDSRCRLSMSACRYHAAPGRAQEYAAVESTSFELLVNARLECVEPNVGSGRNSEVLDDWHQRASGIHHEVGKERIGADPGEWLEPHLGRGQARGDEGCMQ